MGSPGVVVSDPTEDEFWEGDSDVVRNIDRKIFPGFRVVKERPEIIEVELNNYSDKVLV